MKTLKPIFCKLLLIVFAFSSYAQEHPFLIVKKSQYADLQAKWKTNQQPFKMIRNVSINRWNNALKPASDKGKYLGSVAEMVNYNIVAFIIDPPNRNKYKNRILELINTANTQLSIIESTGGHGAFMNGASALFNQIIALDIVYNDISTTQRNKAEANIAKLMDFYKSNVNSNAWRLASYGINLVYAIYKKNNNDINFWKKKYDDYLFNKSMTNDGSWGQSTGYVYARIHGNRVAKFGPIDVLEHTGKGTYYNDSRMKSLFEWSNTFAATPSGSYSKFGDTGLTDYQLNLRTNSFYSHKYGNTIAGMTQWNNNRDTDAINPQSFQSTNYLIYILKDTKKYGPVMPTSKLKEQSGAALWDRTDSREALQGILYNLKRNNPNTDQFGHAMEDVNSISISGYGQHMIVNSGTNYVGKNGVGSNYPGYTPINDRWSYAKYQNTVLIGNKTRHDQKHGNGLVDGLVGGNIEFGTTDSGPAINNGSHFRTLHFIHPVGTKSNGYFVVHDQVKPNKSSDNVYIQFQVNTLRNGTKTIKSNQEYEAPINAIVYDKFSTQDNTEKVNLFFTSNPQVAIVDSYKGDFKQQDDKTDNVKAQYQTNTDGFVRATTLIFPQDGTHKKPVIAKISNANYNGAIVSHNTNFKDYYIGASPSISNTYGNISFKGSTTFFRKESGKTTMFSSTNGTVFRDTEGVDYGYQASQTVSMVLENNSGTINAKNTTNVTFYRQNISAVKINGRNAEVISATSNKVTVKIPAGRYKVELILGGTGGGNVQAPFGGTPGAIPGTIEAETFDTGGQGVAYNDTDAVNNGSNVAREDEGVDIESRDGSQTIGWTANGEWLEYTVNATSGTYTIEARVATVSTGKSIAVTIDGANLGTFDIPNTGGWGKFRTISIPNITIPGGNSKILRLAFVGGGVNLNWVKFNLNIPTNTAPTVSFLKPTTTTFDVGDNLTVEATADDVDGSIAKVELFFDDKLVKKSPQSGVHIWWNKYDPLMGNLQQGNHVLKLVATDNLGKTATANRTITVRGTTANCEWVQQSGKANDIGANTSHVFVVGANGYLYKSNGNGGWTNPDRTKKLKRLDVDINGDVWAIGQDNKVWQYKYPNGPWLDKNGTGIDIGIAQNVYYIIGLDNKISKYTGNGNYSVLSSGKAKRIDVDGDGNPWVVGMNDFVYQWQGNSFSQKGSLKVLDIGIEPDANQVVVTGVNEKIYHYSGNGAYRELSGTATQVTVDANGVPWILDSNKYIYKRNCVANDRIANAANKDIGVTNAITVYPNPITGNYFTIDFTSIDISYISIFDAQGREVYKTETKSQSIRIEKKLLKNAGLYFVKVVQNGSTFVEKILLK